MADLGHHSPQTTTAQHHKTPVASMKYAGIIVATGLFVLYSEYQATPQQQEHGRRGLFSVELAEDDELLPLLPLRPADIAGFAAAILGLILAAGGGIGGGGLLVPIYILVLGFPVKHAVSLSNVTVFGGALANTILNVGKRHPKADRPLIDWNLLAMMEPLTMAGALLGADFNEILPDVVVVIMLVLLLGFTTVKTLEKANKMHATETAECRGVHDEKESLMIHRATGTNTDDGERALSYGTEDSSHSEDDNDHDQRARENTRKLAKLLKQESKTPWKRICEMSSLFFVVVALNLLKGSGNAMEWFPFEIKCGTIPFFLLEKINLVVIVLFAIYIRRQLILDTTKKQALSYVFAPGDVIWDSFNTLKYSAICSLAGLFAGLFGIGGGVVKSPLMLEMGVHPAVASATSATMILFTSFTATTSFMVFGEMNYQYAAVCVVLGFVSTILGQLLMQALLSKYNRNSYIAYSIALVVGVSAAAMTLESVLAIAQGYSHKGAGMCSSFGH